MKGTLFIVSGPSGSGQDSVIEGLKKYFPLERVITTTTRKMRPEDSWGKPYYFISRKEFEAGIKEGKFFEYAKQYNGQYYGVTNEEIERVKEIGGLGIWKMEYQGVLTAKKKMSGIKAILISAPIEVLEERIRRRGGISEEAIRERTEYTRRLYEHKDIYDYEVVNEQGKLDETVKKAADIIRREIGVDKQ